MGYQARKLNLFLFEISFAESATTVALQAKDYRSCSVWGTLQWWGRYSSACIEDNEINGFWYFLCLQEKLSDAFTTDA